MRPRFVIAPDSFKESLTAPQAAEAMRRGVLAAAPDAEVVCLPIADGGEGFVETLIAEGRGEVIRERVTGPLGDPVEATWGLMADGQAAVIEMAQAAGLEQVPPPRRDPTRTTTFGVGELMRAAAKRGAEEIIVGIGGSATNDGGLGMAQALGHRALDDRGDQIASPATGGDLSRVARVVPPADSERVGLKIVRVACDVDNPLLGPHGATHVYAAQKGASPEQIDLLEAAMSRFANVLAKDLGAEVRGLPGAGAAGGLGAGLVAFAGARLEPGAALVLDVLGFDNHIEGATAVLTGEGAVNLQTLRGKAPWEVHRRACAHSVPTLIFAGDISAALPELEEHPLLSLRAIAPAGMSRERSIAEAPALLERAAREEVAVILQRHQSLHSDCD